MMTQNFHHFLYVFHSAPCCWELLECGADSSPSIILGERKDEFEQAFLEKVKPILDPMNVQTKR